jgi:hypothetical protein
VDLFSAPKRILIKRILKNRTFRYVIPDCTQFGQKKLENTEVKSIASPRTAFTALIFTQLKISHFFFFVSLAEFHLNRTPSTENREKFIYARK